MRAAAAAAVLLFALGLGCFPAPLDESGRRCDDAAGRRCGDGFVCFDGLCYLPEDIDAGPENWLENGGFERTNDAGTLPVLWRDLFAGGDIASDTTFVHEGLRSVRLFSRDGGDITGVQMTGGAELHDTRAGQTWCARAWVRSNSPDGGLTALLYLRERPDDGGVTVNENEPGRVRVDTTWALLQESLVTKGAERFDVRVQNLNRVKKNELLWVDDVRLKRSATNSCTW